MASKSTRSSQAESGVGELEQDLSPSVKGKEREALSRLAARLVADRPVPRAGLRSEIRSRLLRGGAKQAPARLGALIAGYAAAGALLLTVAAVGLLGAGPFAA